MAVVEIPLRSRTFPGLVALIDSDDLDRVLQYQWHPHWNQYTRSFFARSAIRASQPSVYMHRLILNATAEQRVDHRDNNGIDPMRTLWNWRSNLRFCTVAENQMNRVKHYGLRDRRSSLFKGVCRDAARSKWQARIGHRHLGRFDTELDAARAYDRAALTLFGEFARLNFADSVAG